MTVLTLFCYINDANLCQASFASFTPTGKTLKENKKEKETREVPLY